MVDISCWENLKKIHLNKNKTQHRCHSWLTVPWGLPPMTSKPTEKPQLSSCQDFDLRHQGGQPNIIGFSPMNFGAILGEVYGGITKV